MKAQSINIRGCMHIYMWITASDASRAISSKANQSKVKDREEMIKTKINILES